MNNAELQHAREDCCNLEWKPERLKVLEKHILPIIARREIAGTPFLASIPTTCSLDRTENDAPKQLQLRDILMGPFTPAGRLASGYPTEERIMLADCQIIAY